MTDFVVYHNQDTQGGPPGSKGDGLFRIGTAKANPERLLDNCKVWVLSGRGTPKKWSLHYWFIPSGFEPSSRGTSICGEHGASAASREGVPLDNFGWFQRLYLNRKLFSFGLQSLASKEGLLLAEEFEKVAKDWPGPGPAKVAPPPARVLPHAAGPGIAGNRSMDTLTMNIKREYFAAIVAKEKVDEFRPMSEFWRERVEPMTVPFKLRLLNGMTPPVPEAVVVVELVTRDRKFNEYILHIGKVLSLKHWNKKTGRPMV